MHTHRIHHPHLHWSKDATQVAFILLLALFFLVLLFLFLTITAQPVYAQRSVPPTARQAATMPQFASRLAPHASAARASRYLEGYRPQASYKKPADLRAMGARGFLPADDIVYDNGPINGTTDAWTLNFGFAVSNTFTVPSGGATLTGMTFGAWLFPGDVAQTVEVLIGTSEFGGTLSDQVINLTQQSNCSGNQYGFNICTETGNLSALNLAQGTYWVTLQNATVNTGDPVYWDENSGLSMASQNSVGTIPSEAFTLLGTSSTSTCGPYGCPDCVHGIHDFIDGSPNPGLALDDHGKIYGTTSNGGEHGFGSAFDLLVQGGNWIFTSLYSFLGSTSGQNPSGEVIGPEKALYGTADGGLQQCGSQQNQYCGVVYRLRPSPFVCFIAVCNWNETVIYSFSGEPDAWKPNGHLVFDRAGNLYGTTLNGGAYGQGAIFELTPSNGGWTEKVIYSFTGAADGTQPSTLLLGDDGNLYGTTGGRFDVRQVIFQLARSGDNWNFNLLATFGGCGQHEGTCFPRLLQERSGEFYGVNWHTALVGFPEFWGVLGQIFKMSPSGDGWQFTILDDTIGRLGGCCQGMDVFDAVVVDSAGNIYGTEDHDNFVNYAYGRVFKLIDFGYEQDLTRWYRSPDFSDRDLEVDASGTLYGTTGACGDSKGTVWQLTP